MILLTSKLDKLDVAEQRPPSELAGFLARQYRYVGRVQYAELYELREE